jgi:hypothetical protein
MDLDNPNFELDGRISKEKKQHENEQNFQIETIIG